MCIIIASPAGIRIPEEHIENSALNNPDWYGYSFVNFENKIVTRKFQPRQDIEMMLQYDEDYSTYGHQTPFLMHFRIATQGLINEDNCHPFRVNDNLVMAHNGMLDVRVPKALMDWSDTRYFIHSYLREMPTRYLLKSYTKRLLGDFIGSSKLVFLKDDRTLHFVNRDLGVQDHFTGIWYSNTTYKYGYSLYSRNYKTQLDEYDAAWDTYYEKTYSMTSSKECAPCITSQVLPDSLQDEEGIEMEIGFTPDDDLGTPDAWDWQQQGFRKYDKAVNWGTV